MYYLLGINSLKVLRDLQVSQHHHYYTSQEYEVIVRDSEGVLLSCYFWERLVPRCSGYGHYVVPQHSITQIKEERGLEFLTTYVPRFLCTLRELPSSILCIHQEGDITSYRTVTYMNYSENEINLYHLTDNIRLLEANFSGYFDLIDCRDNIPQMYVGCSSHKNVQNILSTDPDVFLTADFRGRFLDYGVFVYQSILIDKQQLTMLRLMHASLVQKTNCSLKLVIAPELL